MKRVPLSSAGVENAETFDWIAYFEYNNAHLLKIDYTVCNELTCDEIKLITPSIKAFQIGEGSEGKHLWKTVVKFSEKSGYTRYREIMRWFIIEENRHSNTIKRYMNAYGIPTAKHLWIDNVFRLMRKPMGIGCEVIVLVTAEMIALSYYDALAKATRSKQLKIICDQMLHDELRHVVLQSDTLRRLSQRRNKLTNQIVRAVRKILMRATAFVVWRKFRSLFVAGGYSYQDFRSNCKGYLKESMNIESAGQ